MDISVVIPTCNRYNFLKRAIESVLAQNYLPKEIIVVDDGSSDATSQIKKDFEFIKYIYQENSGVSLARNKGIQNATNPWIAFLDDDDTWKKNKLEKQLNIMKNSNAILSYTGKNIFYKTKKTIKKKEIR